MNVGHLCHREGSSVEPVPDLADAVGGFPGQHVRQCLGSGVVQAGHHSPVYARLT